MPKSTLAGHPLHPMLIVAPAALIPFGFILDCLHRATGKDSYADAAYYSLAGGLAGGVAAGIAGAMDYLTIPENTEVKRTANIHASLNGGVLALTAVNLLLKKNRPHHEGGSLLLAAVSTLGILMSGWFGGEMVYEHGMRVKGMSPVERASELAPPDDEFLYRAMQKEEEWLAPAIGPTLQ